MSDEVRRPVHHHPRMIATRSVSCAVGRHAILSQWVSPTHLGHPADIDPGAHPSYPDDETQPALLVLVRERVRILPSIIPSGRKSGFGGQPDEPGIQRRGRSAGTTRLFIVLFVGVDGGLGLAERVLVVIRTSLLLLFIFLLMFRRLGRRA